MAVQHPREPTMSTNRLPTHEFLQEAEREAGRFDWEGTFADYFNMVGDNPSVSRLSHRIVYDAIVANGVEEHPVTGGPSYSLFSDKVYGQDETIESIVEYFASSARRLEIRKRILLLLGPPASGKSTIVALIKEALEDYTRSDEGALFAIKGCPMQEEPLHLIPHNLRPKLQEDYGIYVEGDLCPRCRYMVSSEYKGRISAVPVVRVVFSEQEAIGIGYYVATSNPTDASLLVGSVDTSQLEGDRLEVAGKAFRLDGELNVANRGLMEFVEIFKVDANLLTTLLGLAQEQLIKMDRFGSVYADEAVVAHSNEGDFRSFMADPSSEALRDRIMRIYVPYNLRVRDEVKIYRKLLVSSGLDRVHIPPLTLPAVSTFAVLSRLTSPTKTAISIIDKLRAYDGHDVENFSQDDVAKERQSNPTEGMSGISPRAVMNRLSARAGTPGVVCLSPLNALDSIWQGRSESVSLSEDESASYISYVREAVEDYNERTIHDVRKAFDERFELTAAELMSDYLADVAAALSLDSRNRVPRESERNMREMERQVGVSERAKDNFRREIFTFFEDLKSRNVEFDYTTERRICAAVEKRLFPDQKTLRNELDEPRASSRMAEWRRRRASIHRRLVRSYGYCDICAQDIVEYVVFLLRGNAAFRVDHNDIVWRWPLNPETSPALRSDSPTQTPAAT